MSQDFRELLATGIIKDDREAINENFQSIRSSNSGTAAPTTNLVEGMLFFNSQTKKLYQLMPDLTTWVLFADFGSGTTYVAKAGNAETAAKATGDKNGKDVTSYIAKLEQDADDAFSIKVYNGANTLINTITIPKTEINVMTGASASSAGTSGLVPTPQAGEQDKFLRGDGTFAKAGAVDSVNGQTGDVNIVTIAPGFIQPYGGSSVPDGWLACNGAAVSRTTYADLFAAIGTTYGSGDGSTTFNLPNMNNGSFAEGSNTAGTVKGAGLPNIYSRFVALDSLGDTASGAFHMDGTQATCAYYSWKERPVWAFSAQRSNPIYGNSDTVQPKSVTVKFCIKY